jgi:hypothetical protein
MGVPSVPRRTLLQVLAVLGVALIVQQAAIVFRVLAKYTNEDQVVLWAAARDWGRFVVHQPTYFGQDYGTTFESIPVELVHGLGVRVSTAVPLVLAALTVVSWLLLAGVAWKRRHGLVALLALAAPLVMSSYYSFYTTFYGSAMGRFLVVAGAALALGAGRRLFPFGVAWAMLTFGVATDPSAAILGVPVLVFMLFDRSWDRRTVFAAATASVPGLAWLVGIRLFFGAHPDYAVFKVGVRPSQLGVKQSITHPTRLWDMFAPDLVHQWWIVPVGAAVLVGLLVATRQLRLAAPAVVFVLLVAIAMAMEVVSPVAFRLVLLPESRIMLTLPFALWFLALLVSEHYELSPRPARIAFASVTTLALLTTGVRFADFHHRVTSIATAATRQLAIDGLEGAHGIERECDASARLARATGAGLIVYSGPTLVYACAGLRGSPQTLTDLFERRTWRLEEERDRQRDRLLLWGSFSATCSAQRQRQHECELLRSGPTPVALMRFPRESAITELKRLGIPVRGFGPDCHLIRNFSSRRFLQCS